MLDTIKDSIRNHPYADFKYWFYYNADGTYTVWSKSNNEFTPFMTACITEDGDIKFLEEFIDEINMVEVISAVKSDWSRFKNRPECITANIELMKTNKVECYERMLLGSNLIRVERDHKHNPDEYVKRAMTSLDWLHATDFFTCPASTQYHDSNPSGLLYHSLKVMKRCIDLMKADPFKSCGVKVEDAILVCLVHDWCKIGLYEEYFKNVKNDKGVWEKVSAYKYVNDRAICLGHGVSSMYLAMKFFNLSVEEACAIRYHMGRWNCVDAEVNELQQANRKYPLVHLVQFADQLAIVDY